MDRLLSATVTDGSSGQGQYSKVAAGSESYTHNAIGNLLSKTGVGAYTYGTQAGDCPEGALSKPHAVVTAGSNTYCYDQNGHLRRRKSGATTYTLTYDAENRLIGVSGGTSASFVYDGDGRRVKATFGTETTVYIGDYYEQTGSMIKKYYYAGGQRVAMRENSILYWLLTDRLGSTAITAYLGGDKKAEIRYKAWGRIGTPTAPRLRPISSPGSDGMLLGLYFYKARYYDPALGRWTQPDTVVPNPGNPQDLNRFSYVRNSPLRYTDPTGHWIFEKEPDDYFFIPPSRSPTGQAIRMVGDTCFGECTGAPLTDPQTTAIVQTAIAVLWEPADWGMTLYAWSQGNFSWWDLLGLFPIVSTRTDDVLRAVAEEAEQLPLPGFEEFIRRGVEPYDVGRVDDLARRSIGDVLDIHHVPQKHPASQVIPGYDPDIGPGIALPQPEHRRIPKLTGTYLGTARELVARDLWDLRRYTGAPNSALRELLALVRRIYPGALDK